MNRQIRNIGIISTLKVTAATAFVVLNIPIFGLLYFRIQNDNANLVDMTLIELYGSLYRSLSGSIELTIIQLVIISLTIIKIGPIVARQIIIKKKNSFFIGFITLLILWTVELISNDVTVGLSNAVRFGSSMLNEIFSFNINDLWLVLLIVLPSSVISGYLLGQLIDNKARSL